MVDYDKIRTFNDYRWAFIQEWRDFKQELRMAWADVVLSWREFVSQYWK